MAQLAHELLRGLQVGAIMLYKALWSILFGVAVTAAIDAFVDKDRMARLLGGRDFRTVGRAAAAGAASSSCTFGAAVIGQALFKKGASAEALFAFALSSTNIVFELSILIYVLLGGAFFWGEALAGVVLVAIMYLLARATLPVGVWETSRRRLQEQEGGMPAPASPAPEAVGNSWRKELKSLRGWVRIADRYFITMSRIWRTVVFGFLIAGFIVALVPAGFWAAVFLNPLSFPAVVENAALGVVAGILSFIGSIGIVAFAAALAVGGVGFPGVIGCIVSDQITLPVLNLWRKFYGTKAAAYVLVLFFASMVGASVLVHYIFKAFGWLPTEAQMRAHASQLFAVRIRLDYTLVLTLLFLGLTAGLGVASRVGEARGIRVARSAVRREYDPEAL